MMTSMTMKKNVVEDGEFDIKSRFVVFVVVVVVVSLLYSVSFLSFSLSFSSLFFQSLLMQHDRIRNKLNPTQSIPSPLLF